MYKNKEEKPVLVLLLELYSELNAILVDVSRPYSTLYYL